MSFAMEKTTLTVTQLHLGAPLQWEPLVGTAEHDRRVDAYIPGTGTIQAKRATIACDFFQTVEATSMPYPFTRTYHVSIPMMASPAIAFSIDSFSSTISTPSSVAGTKRARDSSSPSAPSAPSKRLPGFSIMTKDGVDITDNQSRGPKTKEQRDHAAKMRKMGACPSCKRRKQKCDPSHQRVGETAPLMTASNSRNSSVPSLTGPISARSSISPQSSIQSAFTPPAAISYAQTAKPMSFESLGGGGISPSAMFDDFTLAGDAGLFDLEAPMLDDEWALGQPPLGQDFDLFSYDNTFDFDANLFVNNGAPSQQRQQQPQLFAAQQQQQQTYENSMPFSWDLDTSFSGNTDAGVEASASRRVDNGSLNTAVNGEYSSSASQNHAMNRGMLQDTTLGIATQQWLQSDQSINLGINANVLDASSFANYQHVNLSDSSGGSSSISSPLSYVESAGTACTSPISEPSVALAGQSGQERALLSPQPKYHHPGGNAAAVIDHGAGAIGSGHKRTSVKSRHKPTITDSHGDFSSRAEWKCRKCAPSSQCTWKGVSIEDVAEYRIINRVQVLVGSKVSYKCLDSKCSAQSFRRIHDLQRHIGSVHYEHLPPLKGISSTSPLNERQQTLVQDRVFSIGTEIIDSDRLPAQMRITSCLMDTKQHNTVLESRVMSPTTPADQSPSSLMTSPFASELWTHVVTEPGRRAKSTSSSLRRKSEGTLSASACEMPANLLAPCIRRPSSAPSSSSFGAFHAPSVEQPPFAPLSSRTSESSAPPSRETASKTASGFAQKPASSSTSLVNLGSPSHLLPRRQTSGTSQVPEIASPVERSQTISAPATATSGELKQLTTTTVTAPSSATVSKSFHSTASKAKAASAAGLDGFSVLPWHLFVAALSESALTLLTTAFAARNTQDEIQKGCSTYIDGGRMDQMSGLMTRLSVC